MNTWQKNKQTHKFHKTNSFHKLSFPKILKIEALDALSGCHTPSTLLRRALEEAQMQCRSAEAAAKQHLWQKALQCYEEAENKVGDVFFNAKLLKKNKLIIWS